MVLNIKRLKFNPKYFICSKGFVISLTKGLSILNLRFDRHGYVQYYIRDVTTNKRKDYKAHRLVAEYFIENPNNWDEVNHIDGDKKNNNIKNLEWCSRQRNVKHSYDNGLNHSKKCPILCTTNGKTYSSQLEASKALNISRKAISLILKGEVYSFKGLHFEYINKDWKNTKCD